MLRLAPGRSFEPFRTPPEPCFACEYQNMGVAFGGCCDAWLFEAVVVRDLAIVGLAVVGLMGVGRGLTVRSGDASN